MKIAFKETAGNLIKGDKCFVKGSKNLMHFVAQHPSNREVELKNPKGDKLLVGDLCIVYRLPRKTDPIPVII